MIGLPFIKPEEDLVKETIHKYIAYLRPEQMYMMKKLVDAGMFANYRQIMSLALDDFLSDIADYARKNGVEIEDWTKFKKKIINGE